MAKADAAEIARLLREYLQRVALRGGPPYRAKAYARAADSVSALAVPIKQLIAENRLTEKPGGPSRARRRGSIGILSRPIICYEAVAGNVTREVGLSFTSLERPAP